MAKVGNVELAIGQSVESQYPIHYTQSRMFEVKGIDEEVFKISGIFSHGYPTEQLLKDALHKAIAVYHETKRNQKLVIAYRCKATSTLTMNQVREGNFQGSLDGVSKKIGRFDAFTAPMLAIGIDYFVWMQVFTGKENKYYTVDSDHKINNSNDIGWQKIDGMTFIDYSDENYEFFSNIRKGMQELVKKMSVFFDMDAEQAQQLIASNQKLIG